MSFCSCDGILQNTGKPSKQRAVNNGALLIAVLMIADDGTPNQIAKADVIDQAYVDALINHVDSSKRWYPIGTFTNVTDERADPVTESFSDGSSSLVQQGVRAFNGWLVGYAPNYIDQLDSFGCNEFGVFSVDPCGNLVGSVSSDGEFLNPIRVNQGSWNPGQYVKGSDTLAAKVSLSFEFSQLEVDKTLKQILATEMTADLVSITGLRDVDAEVSGASVTGFTAVLTLPYDDFQTPIPMEGLLIGDFILFNDTDQLAVTITTVTEGPAGTYIFVIPSQTAADVLTLTIDRTAKPGFDLSTTINIP